MEDQDELIIRKSECEELGLEANTKAVLEDVGHNADLYLTFVYRRYWHILEVQLWSNNENIAVYGTATHSQGTSYYGGATPAKIIDGNINSGWHSNIPYTHLIYIFIRI